MNKLFEIQEFFPIPDGTLLSPFLNSKDANSDLPFDLVDEFSIAGGEIKAGVKSEIHVLPLVTQVTFVLDGSVTIKMQGEEDSEPYTQEVGRNQAAFTPPGTCINLSIMALNRVTLSILSARRIYISSMMMITRFMMTPL